jgi:hypothetical protein
VYRNFTEKQIFLNNTKKGRFEQVRSEPPLKPKKHVRRPKERMRVATPLRQLGFAIPKKKMVISNKVLFGKANFIKCGLILLPRFAHLISSLHISQRR